jgi:hypothetical protein
MFLPGLLVSFALMAATAPRLEAENCRAGWSEAGRGAQSSELVIDLTGEAPLDRAALPPGTIAIACPRASIVPRPQDIRILTELGVSFGLIEERGRRSLWIWSEDGLLRTEVDNGELSRVEAAAVSHWTASAQPRFEARAARR